MTLSIRPQRLTLRLTLAVLLLLALLGGQHVPVARAASIVVTTASDIPASGDGFCSLREAIENAHSDNQSGSTDCAPGSGADTITFAGDYTIIPVTIPLLDLYHNLTIDGSGHNVTVSGDTVRRVFNIQAGAVVTITNLSIINGNASGDRGGGIFNAGTLTVANSTFNGNSASGIGGGGIYNAGTLTVSNSTFNGNSASNIGGGIGNNGNLTIVNSTFSGNSASSGAGIYNSNTLAVSHSTFSGNTASGAAFLDGGGGIYNWGPATITHSTFSGNSGYMGAGIANNDVVTVINSTFGNNSASLAGGGIHNDGTATVIHGTFSGNYAYAAGAGIYNAVLQTLHLRNSLIANSSLWSLPGLGDCANAGTLATNVNNLIENGSCSPALSGDPNLGPLGNNGGSTQTFALLAGSSAIDAAGDCTPYLNPDEDQRGVARPQGISCDIGAYELKEQLGPNFVVNVAEDSDDGSCDLFGLSDCTLREAINAANNYPGTDTITFAGAGDYTINLGSTLTNLNSTLTIDGSGHTVTVSGNNIVGVFIIQPTAVVTLNQLRIINGLDVNFGGIYNFGTLTINNSIISGNRSSNGGGGIHNAGPLTINNSTFSSNNAFTGAGIHNNSSSTVTVSNSTFSGNSAGNSGGVLYNDGTATISHGTLSGNSAPIHGGGIYNNNTLHLRNSLIANSSSGEDCYNIGTLATNINNLMEDGSCSPALSGDPFLGPLGSYGGSTQTLPLLFNSPAIDAGNAASCSATDQRGLARDDLRCDIGAFERRFSDGNQVQKSNLAQAVTYTFGPALGKITRNTTDNPGTITFIKIPAWASQPSNAVTRLWDVSATNSAYSLSVSLCITDTERNSLNVSNLHLWRYNGASWEDKGGTLDTSNPNITCVGTSGVTALSRWTLATGDPAGAPTSVLVVRWVAISKPTAVRLEWQTILDLGVIGYQVERTLDGKTFTAIGSQVPAIGGGTYSVEDSTLPSGKTATYRLIALRTNGARESFGTVTGSMGSQLSLPLIMR